MRHELVHWKINKMFPRDRVLSHGLEFQVLGEVHNVDIDRYIKKTTKYLKKNEYHKLSCCCCNNLLAKGKNARKLSLFAEIYGGIICSCDNQAIVKLSKDGKVISWGDGFKTYKNKKRLWGTMMELAKEDKIQVEVMWEEHREEI